MIIKKLLNGIIVFKYYTGVILFSYIKCVNISGLIFLRFNFGYGAAME